MARMADLDVRADRRRIRDRQDRDRADPDRNHHPPLDANRWAQLFVVAGLALSFGSSAATTGSSTWQALWAWAARRRRLPVRDSARAGDDHPRAAVSGDAHEAAPDRGAGLWLSVDGRIPRSGRGSTSQSIRRRRRWQGLSERRRSRSAARRSGLISFGIQMDGRRG